VEEEHEGIINYAFGLFVAEEVPDILGDKPNAGIEVPRVPNALS
jgi:hypothetical protein